MDIINVIGDSLYQWDTGRKVRIRPRRNLTISEVHFCHAGSSNALVVVPYAENDVMLADIPNILLQTAVNITAYAVIISESGERTICDRTFHVRARSKPEDYAYTETEVLTWQALDERIKSIEENGGAVKTVNGVAPDESGNVEINASPDEAEQLEMLIEADMLLAVHDASGAILTDENGNVILRY